MSVNASYGADQRRTEAPKMTRSVADVLPDGETFDAGLREFDQGAEIAGEVAEELDAGVGS